MGYSSQQRSDHRSPSLSRRRFERGAKALRYLNYWNRLIAIRTTCPKFRREPAR